MMIKNNKNKKLSLNKINPKNLKFLSVIFILWDFQKLVGIYI